MTSDPGSHPAILNPSAGPIGLLSTSPRARRIAESRPDRATLLAFALTVVIAGANFVAVRFSNRELPPFWGAATRFACAALLLFLLVLALRIPLPRGRALVGSLVYGVLSFFASYAFAYWGLLHVPAGFASVIIALVPLLTFFFALAHRLERFRWQGLVGALVALAGIAVVFRDQLSAHAPFASLLALVGAAACIAETNVVVKLFPRAHPIGFNAVAMATGTVLLYGLSVAANEVHVIPSQRNTWIAFGYLVLVGSILLFMLYLFVLARWTASATSYQLVLTPLVTVLLAAWLADETITLPFLLGALLVVAGVYVGALRPSSPAPPIARPTPE